MPPFEAAYLETARTGRLTQKIQSAKAVFNSCTLCPRKCNVDRSSNVLGTCKTGILAAVSSFHPHYGEEAPLVGTNGSGTIFFTHCNLMCSFCQNFEISHQGLGRTVSDDELAAMMLALQDLGCHNINFVTPSHVVPQILSALEIAVRRGLRIPLVYNSGGYDAIHTLKLLDGVIDIYMPDFKFWDSQIADTICRAPDYPETARNALIEMHRQVGDLVIDKNGIAQRGLLVRHLVLPENLAGTRHIMKFIHDTISADTYVNIMSQYRPCGRAHETPGLDRMVSADEYKKALKAAGAEGIHRLDRF